MNKNKKIDKLEENIRFYKSYVAELRQDKFELREEISKLKEIIKLINK